MTNVFNLANPLTDELFKNTKEMNEEGFQWLFSCYNNSIERLNTILYQDVYKVELRNVKGHCAYNIVSTSEHEKKILEKILHYNTFPENKALNILKEL